MKYEIPESQLPRPAIPTPEDALAAVQATIADVVGDTWQPIIQQAVTELIFTDLIEPLLATARTWQERAVHRREQFSRLAHRWSAVRDLVLGNAAPDEAQQLIKAQIASYYQADGHLPGMAGFGLYGLVGLMDPGKFTEQQVDELHARRMHPLYEYRTTSGPRKKWDDVDTPPPGTGWELNKTSEEPDAFFRDDYREERYWRRLKSAPAQSEELSA